MRRIQLLLAIWITLGVAVAAGSQASDGALSASLRAHLQSEQFQVVTAIRGLPLGIRDELQRMFSGLVLSRIRIFRFAGCSWRLARTISIALSITSAAVVNTRGIWRCLNGPRT